MTRHVINDRDEHLSRRMSNGIVIAGSCFYCSIDATYIFCFAIVFHLLYVRVFATNAWILPFVSGMIDPFPRAK